MHTVYTEWELSNTLCVYVSVSVCLSKGWPIIWRCTKHTDAMLKQNFGLIECTSFKATDATITTQALTCHIVNQKFVLCVQTSYYRYVHVYMWLTHLTKAYVKFIHIYLCILYWRHSPLTDSVRDVNGSHFPWFLLGYPWGEHKWAKVESRVLHTARWAREVWQELHTRHRIITFTIDSCECMCTVYRGE